MDRKVFIIAEAGVNHNGRVDLACGLIDAAKIAGADAIKFQTFKTEKLIARGTALAGYQKTQLNLQDNDHKDPLSQFDMIKELELSYTEFRQLKTYSDKAGIMFLSTPDESDSLDFLADELDLEYIKVGSGDIDNYPFLTRVAQKQKKVILSTGMATIGEVETAVKIIRQYNGEPLYVLHCTTNYPCPYSQVNLKAMITLKKTFNTKVGYSDHTLGTEVSVAAVALGARIIEKHLTLDKNMKGPDHSASLEPEEFNGLVRSIRNIEEALGDGVKQPTDDEIRIKKVVRKRITASRDLFIGHILSDKDIVFMRGNIGATADAYDLILNNKVKKRIKKGEGIEISALADSGKG